MAAGTMLAIYATYGFEPVGRMEPYPGRRPHVMIVRPLGAAGRRAAGRERCPAPQRAA
ncbi:hypothetical protein Y717_27015 [Streptomyces scopuliridis RB72]|uniref:N-acetyltransferase domain-containing protein n=1 Tax=Streptomyces scopuliridis RB72 TaxID=1440053 RepID=A0A2T7T671_9ACTN|nr:hypothetical protein Y717_27015 [Streptomyces scopuliridis RB72]